MIFLTGKTSLTTLGHFVKNSVHAIAQGTIGKLRGMSFSKSFISTFASTGGTSLGLTSTPVGAGIVGGVASELAGGDFDVGFVQGWSVNQLNEKLHPGTEYIDKDQIGYGYDSQTLYENVVDEGEWKNYAAIGDIPAKLLIGAGGASGNPYLIGAGYALDGADVLNIQYTHVTGGIDAVTTTKKYSALFDSTTNPWTEISGTRNYLSDSLSVSRESYIRYEPKLQIRTCLINDFLCTR